MRGEMVGVNNLNLYCGLDLNFASTLEEVSRSSKIANRKSAFFRKAAARRTAQSGVLTHKVFFTPWLASVRRCMFALANWIAGDCDCLWAAYFRRVDWPFDGGSKAVSEDDPRYRAFWNSNSFLAFWKIAGGFATELFPETGGGDCRSFGPVCFQFPASPEFCVG
jgi:hypothetical protein